MAQSPVRSCEICENSPGSRYCTVCEQCFCKSCETSHLKTKSCRNHVFQDADISNPEVKTLICKQHGEKFTYYCNTCKLLTCNICLPTLHNKHDFCLIYDAASKARSRLNKDVFAAEDAVSSSKQTISTSRLTLNTIEDDANKAKGDIAERVTAIFNAIHNTKDGYFKSIEKHKIKELHKLGEDILKIEKVTENSQEVLNKIKSSIAEENNVMLLDSLSDMTKALKSIAFVSTETTVPSKIQFHPVLTTFEAEKMIGDINFVKPNTIITKADTFNFVKSNTAITVGDRVRLKPNFDLSRFSQSISCVNTETAITSSIQFHPVSSKIEAEKLVGNIKFAKQNTIVKEDETTIKVGDRVRVKPSVERPHHGWGCISHRSVGEVLSLEGSVLHIQFPELNDWRGLLREMELA
ncbi:unnamed protein product [Mytilus coruscus]|uniref:B box-type domain-containing protein n=1 Tax=Mytilus coruscus TaxID=42192 RepID=A0A6J8E9Y2_MYTCO|nr:unnamed protein product [Mytilus coruscus]